MAYEITYRLAVGQLRHVSETAQQVLEYHTNLRLAGATEIVIRDSKGLIVTIAYVAKYARKT